MDSALKNFDHPAYNSRNSIWFLNSIPQVKNFLDAVQDPIGKKMCEDIFNDFITEVLEKRAKDLEQGIIHGDFNEQNILCHTMA